MIICSIRRVEGSRLTDFAPDTAHLTQTLSQLTSYPPTFLYITHGTAALNAKGKSADLKSRAI